LILRASSGRSTTSPIPVKLCIQKARD
jgi:hypothetical protein